MKPYMKFYRRVASVHENSKRVCLHMSAELLQIPPHRVPHMKPYMKFYRRVASVHENLQRVCLHMSAEWLQIPPYRAPCMKPYMKFYRRVASVHEDLQRVRLHMSAQLLQILCEAISQDASSATRGGSATTAIRSGSASTGKLISSRNAHEHYARLAPIMKSRLCPSSWLKSVGSELLGDGG